MEERVFGNLEICAVLVPHLTPLSLHCLFNAIPCFFRVCRNRLGVMPASFFHRALVENLARYTPEEIPDLVGPGGILIGAGGPNVVKLLGEILLLPGVYLSGGFLLATLNGDNCLECGDIDKGAVPAPFNPLALTERLERCPRGG